MQELYVKFNSVDQVNHFVSVINCIEANFELGEGKRVIDPRSIMGIFTLDLSQPQELRCDSNEIDLKNKLIPFLYCKKAGYK